MQLVCSRREVARKLCSLLAVKNPGKIGTCFKLFRTVLGRVGVGSILNFGSLFGFMTCFGFAVTVFAVLARSRRKSLGFGNDRLGLCMSL